MLQIVLIFFLGAVLLCAGGWLEKLAWDQYQDLKKQHGYAYRYFGSVHAKADTVDAGLRRQYNELDLAKAQADRDLIQALSGTADVVRLRRINDYVFRIHKDFLLTQELWFKTNGRYFQGKATMPRPPEYAQDGAVAPGFGVTDQVDNWLDVGYADEYAPVQLTCDVYNGPAGQGYIVTARFMAGGRVWSNRMHVGAEKRNVENFRWRSEGR